MNSKNSKWQALCVFLHDQNKTNQENKKVKVNTLHWDEQQHIFINNDLIMWNKIIGNIVIEQGTGYTCC